LPHSAALPATWFPVLVRFADAALQQTSLAARARVLGVRQLGCGLQPAAGCKRRNASHVPSDLVLQATASRYALQLRWRLALCFAAAASATALGRRWAGRGNSGRTREVSDSGWPLQATEHLSAALAAQRVAVRFFYGGHRQQPEQEYCWTG
jgi:hypothetical protein